MAGLTDLVDETYFFPRLQALVECLCKELADAGGPDLCYCGLSVGTLTPLGMISCKDGGGCGAAWVRPMQVFPVGAFPQQAEEAFKCASPLAMQVEIGVARCVPRPVDPRAFPMEPQQMFEATRLYMSDMRAARRALTCCFSQKAPPGQEYLGALGAWEPIEVSGGVSGGTWTGWIG